VESADITTTPSKINPPCGNVAKGVLMRVGKIAVTVDAAVAITAVI
jgi:hypothetical protein